jgi:hypothetical protein
LEQGATFPLPLSFTRTLDGSSRGSPGSFLVAAMFTPGYAERAEALRRSCERFGLPYLLCEVTAIHTSVSMRGTPDPAFAKPNFIRHLLERHRRPVLYLDADCVFRSPPVLVERLLADGTSFAIYNWLADPDNDAFYPVDVRLDGRVIRDRFFDYSHRIGYYSTEQLICSGCVQLYDTSPAAAALLARWQAVIARYPEAQDDHCLAFAFNNGGSKIGGLRCAWLPKEYARSAWWIFTPPVIDHPELPGVGISGHKELPRSAELRNFYAERCEPTDARFAENSVIDVQEKLLYSLADGRLQLLGPLELELHLAERSRAPVTLDIREIRDIPD